MAPAQPPFPTASNFPFHPSPGSQTSILMLESGDGLSVAATRQKAGRLISVALNGVVNEPAGTASAIVIAVFGRVSDDRLSHVAARAEGAIANASNPSTQYLVPSTQYLVPSTQHLVPSTNLSPIIHLDEHGSGSHAVLESAKRL